LKQKLAHHVQCHFDPSGTDTDMNMFIQRIKSVYDEIQALNMVEPVKVIN
jgi:hypothetical protein